MTTTILQLNNSIFGDEGKSSILANSFVEKLQTLHSAQVIRRDLSKEPVRHLTAEYFSAAMTPKEKRTPKQAQLVKVQ